MIRIVRVDGSKIEELGRDNATAILESGSAGGGFHWLHIEDEPDAAERELLTQAGIHPLAIQDALRKRHPPKYERFEDHEFILAKELAQPDRLNSPMLQVAVFLKPGLVVTRCAAKSRAVDRIWTAVNSDSGTTQTPVLVALKLLRAIADQYLELLISFESDLERLEAQAVDDPSDDLLGELTAHRTDLRQLDRALTYHNQMVHHVQQESPLTKERSARYRLNDVVEQFERVNSLAHLHHGITSELVEGVIAMASHRLNGIMKVLTIVTVVFMPLGILAGIYGMNFEYMPELSFRFGYFTVLGAMATVVIALVLLFKRKGWL